MISLILYIPCITPGKNVLHFDIHFVTPVADDIVFAFDNCIVRKLNKQRIHSSWCLSTCLASKVNIKYLLNQEAFVYLKVQFN